MPKNHHISPGCQLQLSASLSHTSLSWPLGQLSKSGHHHSDIVPPDLFNWFSTLKPNLKSPAEWAGKGSPPSSRCPHIPSLTGGGYGGRFCSHHLPSLGELEKQQGTKVLSVRSAGAQGDPQSKQASPTGETGLCPYPAHAEATTVPFLALGALGGACCFSSYFFP